MAGFVKGDVVVLPFPFSDLSTSKKRPALIVANLEGDDFILAQITSAKKFDRYSVKLNKIDFKYGSFSVESFIRPNKLFTADKSIFLYKKSSINKSQIKQVESSLLKIFLD
jgi:mRNA interferase MazF